ncbi:MAG TPA: NAD(P)-binding domain-containing protein [Terriglobales bacterium]|jgi:predicted dinucleotide-binding enzyme|nr:NAD(P)-binding domain-containing protein [Terriglobales bacterium]
MEIGIIGAGNVGGALGKGWAKKGHAVMFGVRDAADPKVVALLKDAGANARAGSVAEAAKFGEVVVFATPSSGRMN